MQAVSGIYCAVARHPTVCSSRSRNSSNRRAEPRLDSVIRRFRLRSADGAPTEAEIKELEEQDRSTPPATTRNEQKGMIEHGLSELGVLASNLLFNAASVRAVRGETYCVHCRGQGTQACTACQGAGILEPEKVRMNQLRHAGNKVQVLLGLAEPKMFDSDWMRSNRCRRCHGTGACPCKYCNGTGMHGPSPGKAP